MSAREMLVTVVLVAAAGCAPLEKSTTATLDGKVAGATAAPTKATAKSRHVLLTYEATVASAPVGSQNVDLWMPVAQDGPFQSVKIVKVDAPACNEINVEPMLGNKIFHVRVPATALPITVHIDYDIQRRERATDFHAAVNGATLTPAERDRYLVATALVPVGEPVLKMAGFEPKAGDATAVARQAYDHVLAKMKYDKPMPNPGWGNGSTQWACSAGYGNCTDFHSYFMSLARTEGIPSRFLMGLPLPSDKTDGEIAGYHCWAEFFVDGKGWIPVDISEADKIADKKPEMVEYFFGGLTVDRVEFTTGRDVKLVPPQQGPTRNFLIYPYCEIDGKEAASDAVVRKLRFKDV